jgi:hypothetical protein
MDSITCIKSISLNEYKAKLGYTPDQKLPIAKTNKDNLRVCHNGQLLASVDKNLDKTKTIIVSTLTDGESEWDYMTNPFEFNIVDGI